MAIGTPTTIGTRIESAGLDAVLTTSAAVPSGALVIFIVGFGGSSAGTISSVSGGSLTYAVDFSQAYNNIIDWGVALVSAQAPSGMASSTAVTFNFTNNQAVAIGGVYCTGLATSSVFDVADGQGQASVTNWDTTATSTTFADTLVIGGSLHDGTQTNTATGGASEIHDFQNAGEAWSMATEYKILSAAGSASLTGTWTGAGITTSAFAAYKGVAAAGAEKQSFYGYRRRMVTR